MTQGSYIEQVQKLIVSQKASSGVDRSHKAAPPPEHEKGEALEGMDASGGGNTVKGSGKGPLEPQAAKEAKE